MFSKVTHEVGNGRESGVVIVKGPNPARVRYQSSCTECETVFKFSIGNLSFHVEKHGIPSHYTVNCPFCKSPVMLKKQSIVAGTEAIDCLRDLPSDKHPNKSLIEEVTKQGQKQCEPLDAAKGYRVVPMMVPGQLHNFPGHIDGEGNAVPHLCVDGDWMLTHLRAMATSGDGNYFNNWVSPVKGK